MRHLIVFALLATPALLSAQTGTVSPGMSHAQVVAALGEPVTSRTKDEYTYLFYQNSCGRECGMNDLVTLLRDSVVDAIFRSPSRHYTGISSSPTEASPVRVARRRGAPLAIPAATAAAGPAKAPPAVVVGNKKMVEVKGTNREIDASGKTIEPTPAAKPEVKVADTPEPRPATPVPSLKSRPVAAPVTAGSKKVIEVKGTNREVTVSGTKTETTTEPVKMAPTKANDTRPSIPVNPPMVNPAPSPAPDKKPTS